MLRRLLPYVPVALATSALAAYAVHGVLAKCGHPAVPLDDAFIHFQYAKRLAGGHFFSYSAGDSYSSGATSFLWPMLLAPFYLLGLTDLSIIWGAWALGFLALGALAVETYRLALPLAGKGASVGAGAMVLCFGGYVWCAASGMEVVPLAWVLAYGLRLSVEWIESPELDRSAKGRRRLLVVALLAPLIRPEGMLTSLLAAGCLAAFPEHRSTTTAIGTKPGRDFAGRAWGLVALGACLSIPLLNLALTGQTRSSTTIVKWLPGNPYYGHGAALAQAVTDNVRLLFATLLDGREWSAVYIPGGARPVAIAALVAIPVAGWQRDRAVRSYLVLAMALAMLIPCTYLTFLWNRLRYLWPFAFAWFVGLACLAGCVAEIGASLWPRLRAVGPVLSAFFAFAFASHLGWTLDDLWMSSSAIDRQQVAIARWAAAALPPESRIGVNDTGAIGYLSGRRTFDVVGLTTPGEAPYWVAGAGSRFEHYERLARSSLQSLPTHFIVYAHWMACDAILGDALHEETVTDQTILGGTTMTAFEARYDLLGSGDRPHAPPRGELIDELDVADLESEAQHQYEVGPTRETENEALSFEVADEVIADGARVRRGADRFVLRGKGGGGRTLVARWVAEVPTEIEARAGATVLGRVLVSPGGFTEAELPLPAALAEDTLALSFVATNGGKFGSAHYWLYRD